MKMVSTRGVKFKFEKSQIVLCYEPDPTKAKVLYESKVLDVGLRRDKYGRKAPEYLVHFNGWNSSWDRFVSEELILDDNEENRALQQLLAQQAIVKLKSKKKRRLIEALLTDRRRKPKGNMGQVVQFAHQKPESQESRKKTISNGKSEKFNVLEVMLQIPDSLKRQLESDFMFVKHYDKLVRLPCQPNVIFILEDYVQSYVRKTESESGKHENCDMRLNLCKEVVDGLRIYFDLTLANLLLYKSEVNQYEYYTTRFKSDDRNSSTNSHNCDIAPHQLEKTFVVNVLDAESTQEIADSSSQEDNSQISILKSEIESALDRTLPLSEKDSSSSSHTLKMESPSTPFLEHLPRLRCRHCHEALSWNLVPASVYDNEPPVPSLIYGAHHLLRLFVKLPELLSRSNMPVKKLEQLGKHLQTFLRYLEEKREEFFHDSDYVDLKENFDSLAR